MQSQAHTAFYRPWRNLAFLTALLAIDDMVEYVRNEEAYGLFYIARDKDGDMELGHALFTSAQETFKRLGVNG